MKIALIQMTIVEGNIKQNIDKAIALINRAISLDADLIVLPELWTTGYSLENIYALAISEENIGALSLLQNLARKHNTYILGGTIPAIVGEKLYNRAYFISNEGTILATYDKIHLIPLLNEDRYFSSGGKICTFIFDGIRCGILICYDLRFPELSRILTVKMGCKILFVPSEWPATRGEHWLILNRARAIENQLFICAINRVGSNENIDFFGHSLIVDPNGTVIAEGSSINEEVITCEIDFSEVDNARENIPTLKNRREELYKWQT